MGRGRVFLVVAVLAFSGAATAATAATQPTSWSLKDMKTAIRALGYPKPRAKRLTCTKFSAAGPGGQYSAFRCSATYPKHRRARFVTEGVGEGGWLCGGKTLAGCKLLRHGFVTTAAVSADGIAAAADLAARGYLFDHDQFPYQVVHFCVQVGSTAWSCAFTVNNAPLSVSLSFKKARGGYVISGTTS
jgi:hypothetical protein